MYVKITGDAVLEGMADVVDGDEQIGRVALAQAAAFWAGTFYQLTPEEIRGKLLIDINPAGGQGYVISVKHSGGETSVFDLPKRGVATFISEEKLGAGARNVQYTKEGDSGIFIAKIGQQGRPSIEQYAERLAIANTAIADELTVEYMSETIAIELHDLFEKKGVHMDTSTPGGRYRAPAGGFYDPVAGKFYQGGWYVAGGGYFG